MEHFKNRSGYAAISALIAAAYMSGWFIFFDEYGKVSQNIIWVVYGMFLTALFACLFWPRKNQPAYGRMILSGLLIPAFVISILGATFGALNPGFPDSMGPLTPVTFDDIWGMSILSLIYFSFVTVFTPYILGVIVSVMFAKDKSV